MREDRRAYWSKLIAEQEASGASIRAFCKQKNLRDHSFYLWRRRLRKKEAVRFVELKTVVANAAPIELFLPGGERLSVPSGVDTATLRIVLDALRR